MSTSKTVARNTITQLIGKVLTTLMSILVVSLLTRRLGDASYGDYATILAYTQVFSVFTDLGINLYVIKQLSTPGTDETREASRAFGFRIVTGAVFLSFGYVLARFLHFSDIQQTGIAIGLLAVFFQSLNSLFVSVLQAKLAMTYAVITEVIGRLVVLLLTVILLHYGKGVIWTIGAVAVGGIVNVFLTFLFTRRILAIHLEWNPPAWKEVLQRSFVISLITILSYLYFKIDSVMLSQLPLQGGLANNVEVGVYNVAYKILEILTLIPIIFLGNVFPILNRLIAQKDPKAINVMQRSINFLSIISFPVVTLLFIYAPQIIRLIAGSQYSASVLPLRILAFALLIFFYCQVFTDALLALNRQTDLLRVYLAATVFNGIANLIAIPYYSYRGAAVTTLLTQCIVLIAPYYLTRKQLNFRFSFTIPGKILAITLIWSVAAWSLRTSSIYLSIPLLLGTYALALFALKVVTPAELRQLRRPEELSR